MKVLTQPNMAKYVCSLVCVGILDSAVLMIWTDGQVAALGWVLWKVLVSAKLHNNLGHIELTKAHCS